jgi:hypothetical protein
MMFQFYNGLFSVRITRRMTADETVWDLEGLTTFRFQRGVLRAVLDCGFIQTTIEHCQLQEVIVNSENVFGCHHTYLLGTNVSFEENALIVKNKLYRTSVCTNAHNYHKYCKAAYDSTIVMERLT